MIPTDPATLLATARADYQAGRVEQALQALHAAPHDARCQSQLGHWLFKAQRLALAREAYERALAAAPNDADTAYNLGGVCQTMGQWADARQAFERAVRLRPQFHEALSRLAVVLAALAQHDAAGRTFEAALACAQPSAYAYRQYAQWLLGRSQPDDALRALDAARARAPDTPQSTFLRGCALSALGRLDDAARAFEHSLAHAPRSVECRYNLATVYKDLGQLDAARQHYAALLATHPTHVSAQLNLAWVLEELGDLPAATAGYAELLAREPNNAKVHVNLACLLARQGDLGGAWPHWEWRFAPDRGADRVAAAPPVTTATRWTGGDLQGKRVLIWPEQGFGDMLQFCRFAQRLKARGAAHVTVAAHPALQSLLASAPGIDCVIAPPAAKETTPNGEFDVWCWLMSLPLYLQTRTLDDIPARLPYLRAPAMARDRMQNALPARDPAHAGGLRIGVVWRGNPAHRNDTCRSLPGVDTLASLVHAAPAGSVFVNLQFRDATNRLGTAPLHLPQPAVEDFADAAAIIEGLDLVICVDTATAHLAGALGCPTWVLLPANGTDWRWLVDRTDSPWYPQVMRLFRQNRGETWAPVIDRVATALAHFPPRLAANCASVS